MRSIVPWIPIALLAVLACSGLLAFLHQCETGLGVTALGRFQPWGIYVGAAAFLGGIAASTLALSPHLDRAPPVAIAASLGGLLLLLVDLGAPGHLSEAIRHLSFGSVLVWDLIALSGALLIAVVMRRGGAHAARLAPICLPWALGIPILAAALRAPEDPAGLVVVRSLSWAAIAGPGWLLCQKDSWITRGLALAISVRLLLAAFGAVPSLAGAALLAAALPALLCGIAGRRLAGALALSGVFCDQVWQRGSVIEWRIVIGALALTLLVEAASRSARGRKFHRVAGVRASPVPSRQ
jgi:hypothetical protein